MQNSDLNNYITKRLISNLISKYKLELTDGKSLETINKELLVHDNKIREEVIKNLSKYQPKIRKEELPNKNNLTNSMGLEKTTKVPNRESISHIINSDLSNNELDDFQTILERHKHVFKDSNTINQIDNIETNQKKENNTKNINQSIPKEEQKVKKKTSNNTNNESSGIVKNEHTGLKGLFTFIRQNPKFEFAIFMILIFLITLLTLNVVDPINKSNGSCPYVSDKDIYRVSQFYWTGNNLFTINQMKDFINAYYGGHICSYIDSDDVEKLRDSYEKYYAD